MQQEQFTPVPRFAAGTDWFADIERPLEAEEMRPGVDYVETEAPPATWTNPCLKCRGSGRFRSYSGRILGPCHACKGKGEMTYRTAPEQRQKAQARSNATKVNKAIRAVNDAVAWMAEHPTEALWIATKRESFGFAQAMADALAKYGALTERQMETVQRLAAQDIERNAARAAEKIEREASAPEISIAAIETALQAAKASGLKSPKLKLAGFKFSLAPAHGVNAGAIYVKSGEEYLGKIVQAKFLKVRTCEAVTEAEVLKVAADPKGEAIAYGRRTGSCACCGRELTNAASIELGIGPICAEKFGW